MTALSQCAGERLFLPRSTSPAQVIKQIGFQSHCCHAGHLIGLSIDLFSHLVAPYWSSQLFLKDVPHARAETRVAPDKRQSNPVESSKITSVTWKVQLKFCYLWETAVLWLNLKSPPPVSNVFSLLSLQCMEWCVQRSNSEFHCPHLKSLVEARVH